jgi:hypothetical protein
MATTTRHIGRTDHDSPDSAVDALLDAGNIEGARAEFERLCLESLDSGDPVPMTAAKWEQFRIDLHRKASPAF